VRSILHGVKQWHWATELNALQYKGITFKKNLFLLSVDFINNVDI